MNTLKLYKLNIASSLESYISYVNSIKNFSLEVELKIFNKFSLNSDQRLLKILLLPNLKHVVNIARKYSGYGINIGDLIQEGNIGLLKAIKNFKSSFNVRIITYAYMKIKSAINEYILRNWKIVKIATTKAQRKLFFKLNEIKSKYISFNKKEKLDESKIHNVKISDFDDMEKKKNIKNIDIYNNVNIYEGNNLENSIINENIKYKLKLAIKSLNEKETNIIKMRYFNDERKSLSELAKLYSLSIERIRQIESNAILKIKNLLNGDNMIYICKKCGTQNKFLEKYNNKENFVCSNCGETIFVNNEKQNFECFGCPFSNTSCNSKK